MKKESKRQIKDYSRFDYEDREYYGLLPKGGKLRIDVKRYIMYMHPSQRVKDGMNVPRNNAYFKPAKENYFDYNINYFLSVIKTVRKEWIQEIKPAMEKVMTPKEAGDKEYCGYWMQTGIMDYGEVSVHANMQALKRARAYANVMESFYAQFIHQFASRIEAITVKVLKKNNHEVDHFSRVRLKDIYNGATKKQLEDLSTYKYYDQFYKVWNFLKHNSISAYKKLRDNYPELLYLPEKNVYENGNLAISYLALNEELIYSFMDNLKLFFNEFCSVFFNENVEDADWNYDRYFYNQVDSEIESIVNPLGLPPWI